jgi:hypothetical protein
MIVAYVTGHGFGHATRTAEVLRCLREIAPGVRLAIVGSAPERLFREAIGGQVELRTEECDVGLVQQSALAIDEPASLLRWREFTKDWEQRVERERLFLRSKGARLVLGDVPPLAFAAAARAGVPSVALANFSWDWIYRHLAARQPGLLEAASWAAAEYAKATLLLRLPFAGDLAVFPRIEDVPLVARRPRVARDAALARLGLSGAPVVLWSFGGHALPDFDYELLERLEEFRFIVTDGALRSLPRNVSQVSEGQLREIVLGYVDLVGAATIVVCKPGYGIVSDALGAHTRMVYTDRGDFPEYPILVDEMARYMPCAYVRSEELLAGRIRPALDAVLRSSWPAPPPLNGARVAAGRLLDMAGMQL